MSTRLISTSSPCRIAAAMKTPAGTTPLTGSSQRGSASAESISTPTLSITGWNQGTIRAFAIASFSSS